VAATWKSWSLLPGTVRSHIQPVLAGGIAPPITVAIVPLAVFSRSPFDSLSAGRNLSNCLKHQATCVISTSSCDSMVGRGLLIQALAGSFGATGRDRNRSGRAA
jgi:hypothetical protein